MCLLLMVLILFQLISVELEAGVESGSGVEQGGGLGLIGLG